MSSDASSDGDTFNEDEQDQHEPAMFVSLLENCACLFDKSQTPFAKAQKQKAILSLKKGYTINTGKEISDKQVLKKLSNMKARVKRKSDVMRTGNKRIRLANWESDFLKLMNSTENPTLCKVPGK